jgi:CheY-like chemotaxis protein
MVIEGVVQGSVTPLRLDVDCFYLWYAERRDARVTVRREPASDTPVSPRDTAVRRTPFSLEDVRVLIVDSDETAVDSWTRYLETLGARVTSATDEREALAIVRQDTIDVLVADLTIGGFHLAEAVRMLGRPITLIAVSAFVDRYRRALAAGFDSYFDSCLLKPLDPFDLACEILEKRD